jgi:NADH-quinone oxidoreductase subunit E
MKPMNSTLASLFSDFDAMAYFFVNSGIFIGIIAGTFLFIGLLFGLLTWGRYRRRWLQAEEVVESLKSENATLKRRLSEQSTRPLVSFNQQRSQLTLAPLPMPTLHFPVGHMFCLWMEPEWKPPVITPQPIVPSKAFSIWTEEDFKPKLGFPPARGFTLWTEEDWAPPVISQPPLRSARSFTIWTEKDWAPAKREFFPSLAFSLWTEEDWTPTVQPVQKAPSSAAHSLWTEADWTPIKRPFQPHSLWTSDDWEPVTTTSFKTPASEAFSLWTEEDWTPIKRPFQPHTLWTSEDWEPTTTTSSKTPASEAFSLWTEEGYEPPKPPLWPSKAFTLWTQNGWMPAPSAPQKLHTSRAFSIWTETIGAPSVAAIFSKALPKKETSRVPTLAARELAMLPQGPTTVPSPQMMASVAASVKSVSGAPRATSSVPTVSTSVSANPAPIKGFFARALTALGLAPKATSLPEPPRESIFVAPPAPAFVSSPAPKTTTAAIPVLDSSLSPKTTPVPAMPSTEAAVTPDPLPPTNIEPVIKAPIPVSSPVTILPITQPAATLPANKVFSAKPRPELTEAILPVPSLDAKNPAAPASIETPKSEAPSEKLPELPETVATPEQRPVKKVKPGIIFIEELYTGKVRNDLLLGIVYQNKPEKVDDLTAIKGVAETLQQRLNETGIYTFKQIAMWSVEQAREFSSRLSFKDRVEREHWVEQANDLHFQKYGEHL